MARKILMIICLGFLFLGCSSKEETPSVKSILVEQLANSHSNEVWFVPSKKAIEGLTSEQANWKDSTANHSIKELVSHLIFWNEVNLRVFKGEEVLDLNEENEKTFQKSNAKEWHALVKELDNIQDAWELETQNASKEQIKEWGADIANMSSHTAYHTGQIIYIRKQQGWWK
ncbi:MAG: putative damage-inducible protein DinB [Dokdonia sp.]|jgi:uncharacterized damage-inducible protein DinB